MSKKTIFLVAGRSAAGKSSLVHAVCEKTGLVPVKSYATRPPRPGETSETPIISLFQRKTSQDMKTIWLRTQKSTAPNIL